MHLKKPDKGNDVINRESITTQELRNAQDQFILYTNFP